MGADLQEQQLLSSIHSGTDDSSGTGREANMFRYTSSPQSLQALTPPAVLQQRELEREKKSKGKVWKVDGRESEIGTFLYKALGSPHLERRVRILVTKEEFRLEQVLRRATGMFRAMESLSYKKKLGEFGLLSPAK
ncbi:hypothetical protein QYF61_015124 [Mycteria americana]|uniref:Uncharacterized protein n=1 Tax=Mycteria americana TaxID=33587 RepID=A0AAN7PGL4_MYCAM|nr:hypothetical protein QYF61_015124 [Mycteria americana]